jgi:chromate reductase
MAGLDPAIHPETSWMAGARPAMTSVENSMARDVVVIVGSVRKESLNLKLAHALAALAPDSIELEIVPIGQLPLYNPDLDATPWPQWSAFKARVKQADAVLFVTPEHNRSVPAALKNALDMASRPYGANAWDAKPTAIVSASPSAIGGFGANHHLRQSLVFLNMPAMAQPEAYIGHADKLFGEDGKLNNEGTEKFLRTFLTAFDKWIEANSAR